MFMPGKYSCTPRRRGSGMNSLCTFLTMEPQIANACFPFQLLYGTSLPTSPLDRNTHGLVSQHTQRPNVATMDSLMVDFWSCQFFLQALLLQRNYHMHSFSRSTQGKASVAISPFRALQLLRYQKAICQSSRWDEASCCRAQEYPRNH